MMGRSSAVLFAFCSGIPNHPKGVVYERRTCFESRMRRVMVSVHKQEHEPYINVGLCHPVTKVSMKVHDVKE